MLQVTIGKKRSGGTAWLDAPAAAAYDRMLQAGCPAGGITDAGRTNAEQWTLWRAYLAGELAATAAYPGTSRHESGAALDLTGAAREWVRAHGASYGWIKDRVRNEPWHLEYSPAHDEHAGRPVSDPVVTTPVSPTVPDPVPVLPDPLTPTTTTDVSPEEDDTMRDQIIAMFLRRWGQMPTAADLAYQLEQAAKTADKPAFFTRLDGALMADGRFAAFAALGSDAARVARINEVAKAAGWA